MTYQLIEGKYYELKPINPKSLKARFTNLTKKRNKLLTLREKYRLEVSKIESELESLEKLIASNEELLKQFKGGS